MLSIKKNMYNNMNRRYVIYRNRIQNSYNLLIIFLAADGGWLPAANFTLVTIFTEIKFLQVTINERVVYEATNHTDYI